MKVKIMVETEIDVAFVDITVPVNYGTEDIPDDFPMRIDNIWKARIDLDSATIVGWPEGKSGSMYMKVSDGGVYTLISRSGEQVASINGDYVPNNLIPGEYGDYINLEINETGRITNWKRSPSLDEFFKEQEQ